MIKSYLLDIFDMGGNHVCGLYDNTVDIDGNAYDVRYEEERGGAKTLSFRVPLKIGEEQNYRLEYLRNEYLVRSIEDSVTDWYIMDEPSDVHNGGDVYVDCVCQHISTVLNRKNLFGYFDDENGVGAIDDLITKVLGGTGWTLGYCDTIYESDGTTEKIRSYKCDEKTAAYRMIQDICNLFCAYPVFHGDGRTVDIRAITNTDGLIELSLRKNMKSVKRTRDSKDIVTRLYVQGTYGDDDEYVGIESVNPTGLPFILNFDYYREIGAFKEEHEAALEEYVTTMAAARAALSEATAEREALLTQLATAWGSRGFVYYEVTGGVAAPLVYGNGATESDAAFAAGDKVAAVKQYGEYAYVAASPGMRFGTGVKWAVKFVEHVGGSLLAKDNAISAKTTTVTTLTEAKADADTDTEKDEIQKQIDATTAEIAALAVAAYDLMEECIGACQDIALDDVAIEDATQDIEDAENAFSTVLGPFLKDGAWTDEQYIAGQEQSLYNDAVELLKTMSRPIYTYNLSVVDLSGVDEYADETFVINRKVRIYDEVLGINDYGVVEKRTIWPKNSWKNGLTITTDMKATSSSSISDVMSRIVNQANILKERSTIYDRARALGGDGTLAADRLNGEIDILSNRIGNAVSGTYTDENGNWIFEAADGGSAMMLTGAGFMLASDKDASDNWKWRTFGTGEGFTADMMTTGVLRAGVITILGSDRFYWNEENIYIFHPSDSDKQIRIGCYDGTNYGIAFTQDGGDTWQTAIDFNGAAISSETVQFIINEVEQSTVITGLEGEITALNLRADGIEADVSAVDGRVTTVSQTVSGIQTTVTGHTGDISTLQQTDTAIRAEFAAADSALAGSITSTASGLRTEFQNADAGVRTYVDTTAGTINARIDGVDGDITEIEADLTGVTTRVTSAENSISTLSTTVSGISATVSAHDGRITTAQATADGVSVRVNNALTSDGAAKALDTTNAQETGVSVIIKNDEIDFDVPGDNGDTKWDNSGMTIVSINSPSVQPMFWTASSEESLPISIAISDTPVTGADTYGSLAEVFSMLSSKNIPPYGISIVVYKDLFEQDIQLHNVGGGQITISNTGGHVVSGDMTFEYATAPITIDSVKMTAARNIHVLQFNHCNDVTLNRVSITGDLTTAPQRAGVRMQSSNVVATECDISNTYNAFYALAGSHLVIDSCVGSGNTRSFNGGTGAIISLLNTIPNYTSKKHNSDGSTLIVDNGNAVPTSGSGGDDPVVTTTVTLNAAIMRTRNDGGWMTGTQLKSGWYSGAGKHYGLCVFDISALVNKGYTLKTATLKFKRLSGVGAGASSVVYIGASTNSSASGGVNAVKASNGISVAQNSTVTATLTTSVAQGLLDGTYKSLCFVHPTDDSKYGSAPYSRNYMGIDTASASLPKLTLTYTT